MRDAACPLSTRGGEGGCTSVGERASLAPAAAQDRADSIEELCLYFFLIALGSGAAAFAEASLPVWVAESTLARVRQEYMTSLLRQDLGWFDTNRGGEATAKLAESTLTMSQGMEKFPQILRSFCQLICGVTIGFTKYLAARPRPPARAQTRGW